MSLERDMQLARESFLDSIRVVDSSLTDDEVKSLLGVFFELVGDGQIDVYPHPRVYTPFAKSNNKQGSTIQVPLTFVGQSQEGILGMRKKLLSTVIDAVLFAEWDREGVRARLTSLREKVQNLDS